MIARIGLQLLNSTNKNLVGAINMTEKSMASFSIIKKKKKSDNANDDKKRLEDNQQLLLDKFKQRKTTRYAQTKDGFRVDVGLVINRYPIFLNLEKYELDRMKYRTLYQKKYKRHMEIPEDLTDFNFKDPQMEAEETNIDNIATHFIDLGAGEKIEYCESSKYYRKVDPEVSDPRSLQYAPCHRTYLLMKDPTTNQYGFPTRPVLDREVLNEAKLLLWEKISNLKFQVSHTAVIPNFAARRDFYEHELSNPMNRNLKGVKTFYFIATHVQGIPWINPEVYQEYLWTPKRHFQNYVSKEYYEQFINAMHDV
ncbi:hypothetical protein ABPG74_009312 [Tetrahymena malaccensis]